MALCSCGVCWGHPWVLYGRGYQHPHAAHQEMHPWGSQPRSSCSRRGRCVSPGVAPLSPPAARGPGEPRSCHGTRLSPRGAVRQGARPCLQSSLQSSETGKVWAVQTPPGAAPPHRGQTIPGDSPGLRGEAPPRTPPPMGAGLPAPTPGALQLAGSSGRSPDGLRLRWPPHGRTWPAPTPALPQPFRVFCAAGSRPRPLARSCTSHIPQDSPEAGSNTRSQHHPAHGATTT